jgi:hypothetical protein
LVKRTKPCKFARLRVRYCFLEKVIAATYSNKKINIESIFDKDVIEILVVVAHYFEGIFYGDVKKLETVFHSHACYSVI